MQIILFPEKSDDKKKGPPNDQIYRLLMGDDYVTS